MPEHTAYGNPLGKQATIKSDSALYGNFPYNEEKNSVQKYQYREDHAAPHVLKEYLLSYMGLPV